MAERKREAIEYKFEDLRRNSDPVPNLVLAQLGIEADADTQRQEGARRREAARKSDRDERDGDEDEDLDNEDLDRDDDRDLDGDEEVTLTRKELSRELTDVRRRAERKARTEINAAREEAAEVIDKLERRVEGIERRGSTTDLDAEFAPKIKDLEEQLSAAMEAGDSPKVIKLNGELAELRADLKIKKHDAGRARTRDDDSETDDDGGERKRPRILPRVQRWIDRQDWWDDPDEAHVKAYINRVDRELQEDGYEPTEDSYYRKLEARIERKFPGVITRTMRNKREREDDDEDDEDLDDRRSARRDTRDDDDDDDRGSRREDARRRQREAGRRSPVGEGDRGGVNRDRRQRRDRDTKTLTPRDQANMRAFGLDPENKKHVDEYVLNKQ